VLDSHGGLTLARCQVPTKPLYHSPAHLDRGIKNTTKGSWVKIRTGRSLSNYRHGQNKPLQQTCSSAGSPQGHSLFSGTPCSGVGSSPGCGWGPAPLWTFMGCRDSLPHHGLLHGLQGTSAPVPGAPPPLLLHRPACLQSCSSHVVSLLSLLLPCHRFLPLLLKSVIPEVLPLLLMDSALASDGSTLELAGIGFIARGRSF